MLMTLHWHSYSKGSASNRILWFYANYVSWQHYAELNNFSFIKGTDGLRHNSWLTLQGHRIILWSTTLQLNQQVCLSDRIQISIIPDLSVWVSLLVKIQDIFSCDQTESQSISWGLFVSKNRNKNKTKKNQLGFQSFWWLNIQLNPVQILQQTWKQVGWSE